MKKIGVLLIICSLFVSCEVPQSQDDLNRQQTKQDQVSVQSRALAAQPVPQVNYFLERKTVAKWTERWDKPSVACYVYLISQGQFIGYYVSNGKPVSTQSYLIPEDKIEYAGSAQVRQAQDIDGTYGSNNPGIRFFTASDVAVEYGGSNFSYLYSDAKLNINVPCLGK